MNLLPNNYLKEMGVSTLSMSSVIGKAKTAVSLLKTPSRLLLPAGQNGLLNFVPDEVYLKAVFRAETGYRLNLKHPMTYNEKLQWIKLYDRKPEYTMYADKYRVREFISKTIGKKYLVPLIGVYQKAKQIPWKQLPERFVLKCNHASGTNIVCTNKQELDFLLVEQKMNSWLRRNAFWGGREWCYKHIEPCIICEEFLNTQDGKTPDDYKFMCFNGVPRLIQVHHDRYGNHTLDYYTPDWKKADLHRIDANTSKTILERPEKINEMLSIAKTLSKGMYYARIDLYYVNGSVYFGEITMYPTGGFSTFTRYEDDLLLGSYIKLPTGD